jgi:hypothetical protein
MLIIRRRKSGIEYQRTACIINHKVMMINNKKMKEVYVCRFKNWIRNNRCGESSPSFSGAIHHAPVLDERER